MISLFFLHGNLGNQIFQISFGYLNYFKFRLKPFFIMKPQNSYQLELFDLPSHFYIKENNILLKILIGFKIIKFIDERSCLIEHWPSINYRKTAVLGYFQSSKYLEKYRKEILRLLSIKPYIITDFNNKFGDLSNSATISFRLGDDYKNHTFSEIGGKAFLDKNWYLSVIKSIDFSVYDNIFVIADDYSKLNEFINISKLNPVIRDFTVHEQFLFLKFSKLCIIPNSSFAWWGGFLNEIDNSRIIAPKNWVGYNTGIEYPNGIMTSRFSWV